MTATGKKHYQDQGFVPSDHKVQKALNRANEQLQEAIQFTPTSERSLYRSVIRWEGDGYAWYWILKG